jgi:phospholipase/carboxylesterase
MPQRPPSSQPGQTMGQWAPGARAASVRPLIRGGQAVVLSGTGARRLGRLNGPGRRRDPMSSPASDASLPPDPGALRLGPEQAGRRLVLLHGWGADADDLIDLAELLVAPEVSVVSLRAPEPHPAGAGRQWYPLLWSAAMVPEPAWEQVPAAREALRRRLVELGASVPLERTALLGFSQGAAMALDVATGADRPLPLSAVIGCSGYPHRGWRPQACGTPVLLTHGLEDPVVSAQHSQDLLTQLQAAGIPVERHLFRGGHGIDPDLLPVLARFLEASWRG